MSPARTLGIDFSVWQDDNSTPQMMDCVKARREGAEFCFVKASQGVYLDPDFTMNWVNAEKAGLIRGAYHYMDWSRPAVEQARFFAGVISNDPGEFAVVDYECRKHVPASGTARLAVHDFLIEFMRITGRIALLYTSPGYWLEYGSADPWWLQFPLWIAHYYEDKPIIPEPWSTWAFWQYTDKGDGLRFGAESKQLDMNWFNGDSAALAKFAGANPLPVPALPKRIRTHGTVNIRNEPTLEQSSDVGDIKATSIDVVEDVGKFWKVSGYIAKSVSDVV